MATLVYRLENASRSGISEYAVVEVHFGRKQIAFKHESSVLIREFKLEEIIPCPTS